MAKSSKDLDKEFMQLALRQAAKGRYTTSPNPAVGCVIVKDGNVIGLGYHHKAGEPHAEINALNSIENGDASGATCYVTLEPCSHYGRTPPCAKALCDAKVKRVVIAMQDPNPKVAGRGIAILQEAGIEVEVGLLNKKAKRLNRAFIKSITKKRPYTYVKYGMSLDGKIALSNNESKWITNEESRSDVQRLRLWADAIITSRATVIADNARLNVRHAQLPEKIRSVLSEDEIKQPLKIIIDSKGEFIKGRNEGNLKGYDIFSTGKTYIVCGSHENLSHEEVVHEPCCACAQSDDEVAQLSQQEANYNKEFNFVEEPWLDNVSIVHVPFVKDEEGNEHASLEATLDFLDSKQVRIAMVEAGSYLGSAFLNANLVDEVYCYIAPIILGKEAKSAFNVHEQENLSLSKRFNFSKAKQLGSDVRITLSNGQDLDESEQA